MSYKVTSTKGFRGSRAIADAKTPYEERTLYFESLLECFVSFFDRFLPIVNVEKNYYLSINHFSQIS